MQRQVDKHWILVSVKTIPPSATEDYNALDLAQFACLICAVYRIRYRDPINSTNCSQSTIQTTNDPVPTLTTTNHLHIPTLFMHQTLCQNLDLPMATWALGPYHHAYVQRIHKQPNKSTMDHLTALYEQIFRGPGEKNASQLQRCNCYLWTDTGISSSRWSKLCACLAYFHLHLLAVWHSLNANPWK
jgi:hypothetical protein